jgi:hypothetical protein
VKGLFLRLVFDFTSKILCFATRPRMYAFDVHKMHHVMLKHLRPRPYTR